MGNRFLLVAAILCVFISDQVAPAIIRAAPLEADLRPAATSLERNWFTSLFAAGKKDPQEEARGTIEAAGWDVDARSLIRAVRTGNAPLVELFLRAGADPNGRDVNGETPLLAALEGEDSAAADRLIAAGADVNLTDSHRLSPLMASAMADQTAQMRMLLSHGAAVDGANEENFTALHLAVLTRSLGAISLLLKSGANCTGGREDLMSDAFESRDWRIIEPILSAQPPRLRWSAVSRALLVEAVAAKDRAKTRLLLSKHLEAPTPEGRSQPLLAYALLADDLPKFKFLLECGANSNTPLNSPVEKTFSQIVPSSMMRDYLGCETGMNTLMLAAGLGKSDFLQALLEKGANRSLGTGKFKMPALLFAAQANDARSMQMLIERCPTPEQVRIEISLGLQQASVIKDGVPVMTTEVSTGKAGFDTPSGDYVVTDKHLSHRSTIYKVDMPFFMRLNCRDFGMHEGVVPGYPASHGCIRLPSEAARKLFSEIPVGTLVSIRD